MKNPTIKPRITNMPDSDLVRYIRNFKVTGISEEVIRFYTEYWTAEDRKRYAR